MKLSTRWLLVIVAVFLAAPTVSAQIAEWEFNTPQFSPQWEIDKPLRLGKIKTIVTPDSTTPIGGMTTTQEFNEKGQLLSVELRTAAGLSRQVVIYNKQGDIDRVQAFYAKKLTKEAEPAVENQAKLQWEEIASYAAPGIIKTITRTEGAAQERRGDFTYKDGRIIQVTMMDKGKKEYTPSGRFEYSYDAQGRLVEMKGIPLGDKPDEQTESARVEYDDKGFPKAVTRFDGGDLAVKSVYEYKYDKVGNWVERTETEIFEGDETTRHTVITKREITYY